MNGMNKQNRLELHAKLVVIVKDVYFQPPANISMNYPCIVYQRIGVDTDSANDKNYIQTDSYQLTVIVKDPEDNIADTLLDSFSKISITSAFTLDNLHHTYLSLYYK